MPLSTVIETCLALAPVPYLSPAFLILKEIWKIVEQAKELREQLVSLTQAVAELLQVLNGRYQSEELDESRTEVHRENLTRFVPTPIQYCVPTNDSCMKTLR